MYVCTVRVGARARGSKRPESIQLADANTILNDAANAVTNISLGLM